MKEKDVKNNESIDLNEVHGGNFLSFMDQKISIVRNVIASPAVKEFVKDTAESKLKEGLSGLCYVSGAKEMSGEFKAEAEYFNMKAKAYEKEATDCWSGK